MAYNTNKIRIQGVDQPSTLNVNNATTQSSYHMADSPNLYEPQRSNNFEFIVSGLSNLVAPDGSGRSISEQAAQDSIRLAVVSSNVPNFSQSVIEVQRGNNTIKYAGTPSFDAGQIVCNDYIGLETKLVLEAWQSLSYNTATQKVGLAGDYKKECSLVEYTPDYQPVRKWTLRGCWISALSEDAFTNESNNKHTVTVTIQYDYAYPTKI